MMRFCRDEKTWMCPFCTSPFVVIPKGGAGGYLDSNVLPTRKEHDNASHGNNQGDEEL
jgi:hypothetical protein